MKSLITHQQIVQGTQNVLKQCGSVQTFSSNPVSLNYLFLVTQCPGLDSFLVPGLTHLCYFPILYTYAKVKIFRDVSRLEHCGHQEQLIRELKRSQTFAQNYIVLKRFVFVYTICQCVIKLFLILISFTNVKFPPPPPQFQWVCDQNFFSINYFTSVRNLPPLSRLYANFKTRKVA